MDMDISAELEEIKNASQRIRTLKAAAIKKAVQDLTGARTILEALFESGQLNVSQTSNIKEAISAVKSAQSKVTTACQDADNELNQMPGLPPLPPALPRAEPEVRTPLIGEGPGVGATA